MPFLKPIRHLNLALQGGGAHGAFTWGVLDRLLEEERIELAWISGTSAGAVNAVALASGLLNGGPTEARATLKRVWDAVESAATSDIARLNPFLYGLTKGSALQPMSGMLSPYDFNPLGLDPFRKLLEAHIDFTRIRADKASPVELVIAATEVATGRPRIFRRKEMTVEAVLASACLPQIHHAVEIDGRAYWDGGFSANPDVLTIATESPTADTLIVQINPLERNGTPRTARDIAGQVNVITFNGPLLRDIETITTAQSEVGQIGFLGRMMLPRRGRLRRLARHRFHLIDAGRHTSSLGAETKSSPERALLDQLFRAGRSETARWLDRHRGDIGKRQTIDLSAHYLERPRDRSALLAPVGETTTPAVVQVTPPGSRI